MSAVIIPNYVSEAIYRKIDAEIEKHPDAAADREQFHDQLLNHFDITGEIPEFTLQKQTP